MKDYITASERLRGLIKTSYLDQLMPVALFIANAIIWYFILKVIIR